MISSSSLFLEKYKIKRTRKQKQTRLSDQAQQGFLGRQSTAWNTVEKYWCRTRKGHQFYSFTSFCSTSTVNRKYEMGKKDKMGRPSASKQQQNMIPPRPKAPTEYQLPPILTREFTEEEVLEFREAFEIFDLDKGGTYDSSIGFCSPLFLV